MKKEKDHKLYRKMGFYERYIKRAIDIFCSGLAIIVFCWLYAIIALLVRIKLGSPVLFTQYRPGLIDPKTGKERIFKMYKFRTMTDKKDAEGNLLPDEIRLTKFGAWLRATSLDELPEAFCILNGTMTLIGPRPQLVRDMVFMSEEQRMRHTAKPGPVSYTHLDVYKRQDLCGVNRAVCLNSQTACAEMALRLLGIKEGDEVITCAYTLSLIHISLPAHSLNIRTWNER